MPSSRLSLHRAFVADHFHDLPGFVEARHGHNWELEATVAVQETRSEAKLDAALDAWVNEVDYTLLNELIWLQGRNPTAEALAQKLLEHLETQGFAAVETRIREKTNYWAACRRESE
jgi:6-pyruvoyl-tetrahydropterin synthase